MTKRKKQNKDTPWQVFGQIRILVAGICMWKLEGRLMTIRFSWVTFPYRLIKVDNHGKTV